MAPTHDASPDQSDGQSGDWLRQPSRLRAVRDRPARQKATASGVQSRELLTGLLFGRAGSQATDISGHMQQAVAEEAASASERPQRPPSAFHALGRGFECCRGRHLLPAKTPHGRLPSRRFASPGQRLPRRTAVCPSANRFLSRSGAVRLSGPVPPASPAVAVPAGLRWARPSVWSRRHR